MENCINVPYAFLQKELKIEDDKPIRKLTICEALVYAFLYNNLKQGRRTVSASYSKIARSLNIAPATVSKSIRSLLLSGLIFRHTESKFYLSQKVFNETFGDLHI